MPNTGRPSRDCHLCRSRRVKCDLGRPGCQRCVKYGSECPGYRDQQELVFRNADPTSLKKRNKRNKHSPGSASETEEISSLSPHGSETSQDTVNSNTRSVVSISGLISEDSSDDILIDDPFLVFADTIELVPPSQREVMPMTKSLQEHWTTHSIPILLNVYSAVDFVHNLYRANCGDGPLVWAAHLFSRTYVTNVRYPTAIYKGSENETKRELGNYLGKTLSAVGAALKTPEGALRDDVLATVWILANYELLIGSLSRSEPLSPWHLHARGLYSILKARGTAPLLTEKGRTAFWPAYNMVQIQALVSSTECPPESEEWLGVIKDNLYMGEALTVNVSIFISKVAHVQSRVLQILRRRDFRAAETQYATLVSDMSSAEEGMNAFLASNTDLEHALDTYMRNMHYSALVKGYHNMQQLANFLTHYPASRIPLDHLRAQRVAWLRTIRAAAQGIIDSLPVAIGPLVNGKDKSPRALFDALKLIWPLSAVYLMPSTRPDQKVEAELALVFIGKELGVRQALSTYPGSHMLPPEAQQPLGGYDSV